MPGGNNNLRRRGQLQVPQPPPFAPAIAIPTAPNIVPPRVIAQPDAPPINPDRLELTETSGVENPHVQFLRGSPEYWPYAPDWMEALYACGISRMSYMTESNRNRWARLYLGSAAESVLPLTFGMYAWKLRFASHNVVAITEPWVRNPQNPANDTDIVNELLLKPGDGAFNMTGTFEPVYGGGFFAPFQTQGYDVGGLIAGWMTGNTLPTYFVAHGYACGMMARALTNPAMAVCRPGAFFQVGPTKTIEPFATMEWNRRWPTSKALIHPTDWFPKLPTTPSEGFLNHGLLRRNAYRKTSRPMTYCGSVKIIGDDRGDPSVPKPDNVEEVWWYHSTKCYLAHSLLGARSRHPDLSILWRNWASSMLALDDAGNVVPGRFIRD